MPSIRDSFLGLFSRPPLLPATTATWQFDTYAWLLKNSGGFEEFKATQLIQPTDEYFPQCGLRGHEMAEALFLQVKKYAGMEEWPCRLEPMEIEPNREVAAGIAIQGGEAGAAGSFAVADDTAIIRYRPDALADPMSLVATFAHELAHYFTGAFPDDAPGGLDNWEFATDVCSIFFGFGLFTVNSVFTFSQFTTFESQGWQSRRTGYLSEAEALHALAIFSTLLEIPTQDVLHQLKNSLRGTYKRVCRDVAAQQGQLDLLRRL